MSTEARKMRAAIASRDAFLSVVAEKLGSLVSTCESADYPPDLRADLASFVRELGIIARPEVPLVLRRTKVDLLATVRRFFVEHPKLAERGIAITEATSGSLVGAWDTELLGALLGELASNAIKYRGKGPIVVRVGVSRGKARIVVENDGTRPVPIGPPARFERGDTRPSPRVRGYGVGLWLVERIAKAHGGSSKIENRLGKTRAIVSLPYSRSNGEATLELRLVDARSRRSRKVRALPSAGGAP